MIRLELGLFCSSCIAKAPHKATYNSIKDFITGVF